MATRLTCAISSVAAKRLGAVAVRRKLNKGRTLVYLMDLAKSNAEHEIEDFNDGGRVPCTLNANAEWLEEFQEYRALHGLYQNTDFMKNAVLRGLSIEDGAAGDPPNKS